LERAGDVITREILIRLDRALVTPFDREDIHSLTGHLDDALDDVRAAADLLRLHNVDTPLPEIRDLAALVARAAAVTSRLMTQLSRLRGLQDDINEVFRLESEGDAAYRRAVAHLFSGAYDAFQVLKWKDIIEALERSLNGFEAVAHTVEAIVLKHA
jgi:predicted phosphate transport protein (TIGR00153 family)